MSTGKTIVLACETDCTWAFSAQSLTEKGYQVEVYNKGLEALASAKDKADESSDESSEGESTAGSKTGSENRSIDAFIVSETLDDIDGLGFIAQVRRFNRKAKIVYVCSPTLSSSDASGIVSELKISLIILRPLRESLFVHQIDAIFRPKQTALGNEEALDQNFMSSLGASYGQVLSQRIHELNETCLRAKNTADAPTLAEAKRLAHNMRGTAGSAGFFKIAEHAYELEQALDAYDLDWKLVDEQLLNLKASHKTREQKEYVENRERTISKNNILVVSSSNDLEVLKNDTYNYLQIVSTLEEALATVKKIPVDAILIDFDCFSPEYSVNAASALRGLDDERTVPLAFVTSAISSLPENIVVHGASQIIRRPVNAETWRERILHLVKTLPNGRHRVLMVDDDPDFCDMVSLTLESAGMVVLALQTADTIVHNIQEFVPDLILLDMTMPKLLGTDVCAIIRSMADYKEVPIFFLTAETTLASRMSAFASGADDYLSKPLIPIELISRVKTRIERMKLIKERIERDALTGLLLRRAFTDRLNMLLSQAKRQNFSIALALLDVDNFKVINDTYGHDAGDQVLSEFGKLVRKRFRAEDLRGRWGGEEFVLAFLQTTSTSILGSLDQMLSECKDLKFTSDEKENYSVSFSAGVVTYPADGQDLRTLMLRADERLYRAKRAGRSRIVAEEA